MTKNVKSRIWKGSLAMMFAMLMLVTCMGAAASADNQMLSVTYRLFLPDAGTVNAKNKLVSPRRKA